jgi:zinc protease
MFSRFSLAAFTTVALVASAQAQSLEHEKYSLPNGMTVILHRDASTPRVAVNTWYRVGARNEPAGRSGFAHLFEHLMFMGTKRVPGNDFDVIMETGGGANNASTSLDRTNYFSWGPSALLPTLLWLDADRLEDMGLEMTLEKLDKQRDVVRNERRQTTEEAPYGKAYEASYGLLYPANHPYAKGVIGSHSDLEAATVQDVKDFFSTFYQPNNASLVVAGDFDPSVVKPMIAQMFGSLPAGNVAPQVNVPQPRMDRVIRTTTLDKVQLPAVMMSYHSPGAYADGDAEMDLVGALLSSGNNSRLYERLVIKEGLAAEVSASQDSSAMGSVFRIMVLALPTADMAKVEAAVDDEIAKLVASGPAADELERRKRTFELGLVSSMQSLENRADKLNTYEYYWGTPDGLGRDLGRYRNATPKGIQAWTKAVLTPGARLIQRVLPEEPERVAGPRDARPGNLATGVFTPPAPEEFTLSNGLSVQVFRKPTLPMVTMGLVARAQPGSAMDPVSKAGRSEVLADMLDEGTKEWTGAEFASALQAAGASFGAGASHDSFSASMTVLRTGMEEGMSLFASAITQPRLDASDWERVKKLHIEGLKQSDDEPRVVAARVAAKMLWAQENPYSQPTSGTVASTTGLTLEDMKEALRGISPMRATLVIAGDVIPTDAKALAEKHLGSWKGEVDASAIVAGAGTETFRKLQSAEKGLRVFVVDRPGAAQTMIHLRAPSVEYSNDARVPLSLLNTILGGSFTSRLNQNLREKNGFTYGARTNFGLGASGGTFTAGTSVQSEVTGPAVREFLSELSRIRQGDVSAEEATKARETVRADSIGEFGTLSGLVGQGTSLAGVGMPWSTAAADMERANSVDASALNLLAKSAIRLDEAVLVLVGDKATILSHLSSKEHGLEAFKLPAPTIVDVDGTPVKQTASGN